MVYKKEKKPEQHRHDLLPKKKKKPEQRTIMIYMIISTWTKQQALSSWPTLS